VDSFAFRALTTSNLHEICGVETDNNFTDSHVECSLNRQISDDYDLSTIVKKLRQENLFTIINAEVVKYNLVLLFMMSSTRHSMNNILISVVLLLVAVLWAGTRADMRHM